MAASTLSERLRAGASSPTRTSSSRRPGGPVCGSRSRARCSRRRRPAATTSSATTATGTATTSSRRATAPSRSPRSSTGSTRPSARRPACRRASGPCQLTFIPFQDQADALGGCWKPANNIRIGFKVLADNVKRSGEATGVMRYNGSNDAARAYSKDVLARARKWDAILAGAPAPVISGAKGDRRSSAAATAARASSGSPSGWRSSTPSARRPRTSTRRASGSTRRPWRP